MTLDGLGCCCGHAGGAPLRGAHDCGGDERLHDESSPDHDQISSSMMDGGALGHGNGDPGRNVFQHGDDLAAADDGVHHLVVDERPTSAHTIKTSSISLFF